MIEIIFDTETTGLIKPDAVGLEKQPSIIEIYCYKQERVDNESNFIEDFESFIKPPAPITEEITKITGINNQMVQHAPEFNQISEEIAEFFLGAERLVAHNLAFDLSMLANELLRCDRILQFPWPMSHVCTVQKSMHYQQRRLSLTRLHEHLFDCDFPNAHRAKNDVEPLVRCYNEMVSKGDIL